MMETGSPDQEVACSEEDHQQQGPVSQVRSYECTFCKRGFSNAQALGGHMNIHRKDRIKLKQPANSNHQLSSDFSKMNTSGHPVTINQRNLEFKPNMSCTRKWPWIFPRDDYDVVLSNDEDHVEGEIHQLPLFEETPASSNKREFGSSYHNTGGDEEGTESNPSLDLELRLGTEPHDPSTRTGTIEFF